METLFVLFRVLVIGLDIVVIQALGSGRLAEAHQTTFTVLLAPAMALEACNISMASGLRTHLFALESLWIMVAMRGWAGWGLNG